jgi:hypothetical protein
MKKLEIFNDENGDWAKIYLNGECIFDDHESNFNLGELKDFIDYLGLEVEVTYEHQEME